MRVLLLNDTRADENPGCQATVALLIAELSRLAGGDIATRLRGDGYEYFAPLVTDGRAHSRERWEDAVRRFALASDLVETLHRSDLVVANLEGTFHHHTVGALALGGAMTIAHQMGKRVWAVNGSVEAIDRWLLAAALAPSQWISVREPVSRRWLAGQGIDARLAADCVFLGDRKGTGRGQVGDRKGTGWGQEGDCPLREIGGGGRRALFTPGVLASLGDASCEPAQILRAFEALSAAGCSPTFLRMAEAEEPLAAAVVNSGWHADDNRTIPWQDFGSYLRQFRLVVSGRYHVLIFAAMAGVPAIALRSNTWKIEGLVELFAGQIPRATDVDDLARILAGAPHQPLESAVLRSCRSQARLTLPKGTCSFPPKDTCSFSKKKEQVPFLRFRTALFGASSLGRSIASRLRALPHVELTGFIDNDPAKWGQRCDALRVSSPTQETLAGADVIVISSMYDAPIRDQLIAAGAAHKLTDLATLERLATTA